MTKKQKQKLISDKRAAVVASVTDELRARGIYMPTDDEIIAAYAEEMALAYATGEHIKKLAPSDDATLMRLSRIRNAHLNTANQYAKALKLGPYGRKRFGNSKPKEEKKASILKLSKKTG